MENNIILIILRGINVMLVAMVICQIIQFCIFMQIKIKQEKKKKEEIKKEKWWD